MPKWTRLQKTRDADLVDRVASAFENGYGDEGPLAKGIVNVGCLFIFPLAVIAVFSGLIWGVWVAFGWIF